jgi:chorismate mutase
MTDHQNDHERPPMTTALPVETPAPSAADVSAIDAADAIPTLRAQIDAVDAAIIRLVAERARLSSRIQAARVSSGGTRVELGREREILDAYRTGVGSHGPHLADAILQVCRGNR